MTRHALVASVLVLILGACKSSADPTAGKPAPGDDTSAEAQPDEAKPAEAKPAETKPAETKPAEAPSGDAPAATTAPGPAAADAGPAAATDDTTADTGTALQPSALVGQFGFDWLQPDGAKCVKLDGRLAKKLASKGARCRRRDAAESFDGQSGQWASCRAGTIEWLLYASKKVCQEQLETMQANAP